MPNRLKITLVGICSIKEVLDEESAMVNFYINMYNNNKSLDDDIMVHAVVAI